MKILALHLNTFLEYAEARGIKPENLIEGTTLASASEVVDEISIDHDEFYFILNRMHQSLEDRLLGIRIGHFLKLQSLGLIYQISLKATTLEEAIHFLKDFVHATLPLVHIEASLNHEHNTLALSIKNKQEVLNRIILECLLVIIARELSMMSQDHFHVKLSSPFYTSAYPETFEYGEEFSVHFSSLELKAALKNYQNLQLDYLIPQYLKLINSLKGKDDFLNQVKITALNMATPELPTLEEVADSFHLTARTFQRKLSKEKITYRQIIDELKKEISMLLLHHKSYSIGDISYILGYSEPAAFVHTFKKWYGQAPSKIRVQI